GDRGTAARGVEDLELGAHFLKRRVDHGADRAQGMVGRHDVLEARQADEPRLQLLIPAHVALLIRDLQGLLYQRRAVRGRSTEAADPRRTTEPARISAAC